jgi:hypothetical protein
MRNNDMVRRFKVALVKAFYELRARIAVPPAPTCGPVDHRADILVSADRIFRAVLRSGRAAGLRLPQALSRANLLTEQQTGVNMLEALDAPLPTDPPKLDYSGGGVEAFLREWLAGDLPVPACHCASGDLYLAYRLARQLYGGEVLSINRFGSELTRTQQGIRKSTIWVAVNAQESKNMRAILVCGAPMDGRPLRDRYADDIARFRAALSAWYADNGVPFPREMADPVG